MKKLMMMATTLAAMMSAGAVEFRVSPDGDDKKGDGSAAKPVRTLEKAMKLVRAIERDEDKTIVFADGFYPFERPVRLEKNDADLTIRAEHPGKVIFSGGVTVTGWRQDEEDQRFLAANLPFEPREGITLVFLSSGEWCDIASYPDYPRGRVMKYQAPDGSKSINYDSDKLDFSDIDILSAWLVLPQEWSTLVTGIKEHDAENKIFTFKGGSVNKFNQGYRLMNTRHGMRKPGMWMFENRSKKIIYWPREGETAEKLDITISKAVRQRALESENRALKSRLDSKFGLENIVGSSPAMERLFDIVRQAAPTQATVLIEGASGTGKELVAQAIHRLSARAAGPFVAVHCAALSSSLLESELFGHEKGAFTGAVVQRKGRFEMAHGGTLFLDEISEIEPSVQVKLLRVLEERRFERVGGVDTVDVDIRIIAATNRDLRKYVEEGKFREDLFYRLDVVEIKMPPLKERGGDIALLCNRFMKEFAEVNARPVSRFAPEAAAILQAYSWPGNVRELRNTIEKMVVRARGDTLAAEDVPANIRDEARLNGVSGVSAAPAPAPAADFAPTESLAEVEKRKILAALDAAGGNRSKAAIALGISRRTLHRKLNEWKHDGA